MTLKRRGHNVEIGPDWSEGRLTAASKRRPAPPRRRQSARHAGLRGGAVAMMADRDDLVDHRPRPATGQFGIAVATRFFAVGARVPHIADRLGALATQALVNPLLRHRRR